MTNKPVFLSVLFSVCFFTICLGQEISLVSWNIRDFGKTKSTEEIERIANILKEYDVIALQEVVAGYGGDQAVTSLAGELNRKGSKWDYSISYATKSPKYKTEKYAYIWKTSKVTIADKASLVRDLESCVFREPYRIKFKVCGKSFTLLNYHSRKHSEGPEIEVQCLTDYIINCENDNVIVVGDFNLSEEHHIFNKLKERGYRACLSGHKTTLKRICVEGHYLSHAIDNIFFDSNNIQHLDTGSIDFVSGCDSLETARKLSDHLPVYISYKIKQIQKL